MKYKCFLQRTTIRKSLGLSILALCFFLIMHQYDIQAPHPMRHQQNAPLPLPQEYMKALGLSVFNETGDLKYQLEATHWAYRPEQHASILQHPKLKLYKDQGRLWISTADRGAITQPNLAQMDCLNLEGHVYAQMGPEQPIEIRSQRMRYDPSKGEALYQEQVQTQTANNVLNSDTLLIAKNDRNQIGLLTATGNPSQFHSLPKPQQAAVHGLAHSIDFIPEQHLMILKGAAKLTQNQESIEGEQLYYLTQTRVLYTESHPGARTTILIPRQSTSP